MERVTGDANLCFACFFVISSFQFDVWEDLSGKQTVFRMQGEREKEIERQIDICIKNDRARERERERLNKREKKSK